MDINTGPMKTKTTTRKKALLIGVARLRYDTDGEQSLGAKWENRPLRGTHDDVRRMRKLLREVYGYKSRNIVVLMDDDKPENAHLQPTEANIIQHIKGLVDGAKGDDHFFFHFAGHTGQSKTDDKEEEDGMNEIMMTSDGKEIMDNDLRRYLIDPLPPTCSLTAVMDSCHSCSILDLPHFRCNRVYVPWLDKGHRADNTRWENIRRQQAMRLIPSINLSTTTGLGVQPVVGPSLEDKTPAHHEEAMHPFYALSKDLQQSEPEEIPEIKLDDSNPQHSKWILPRGRQQQSPRTTIHLIEEQPTETDVVHKDNAEDATSWFLPHQQHQWSPEGTLDDWVTRTDISEASSSRTSSSDISLCRINPAKQRKIPHRQKKLAIHVDLVPAEPRHILTPSQPTPATSFASGMLRPPRIERQLSDSPIATYCTGYCRTQPILYDTNEPKAEVVCLSAAKDSELAWQDLKGRSLTHYLVDILREKPERSLRDVLTRVSYKIHEHYIPLHRDSLDYKKGMREFNRQRELQGKEKTDQIDVVEAHNFQNPQISSHRPLDMNKTFRI